MLLLQLITTALIFLAGESQANSWIPATNVCQSVVTPMELEEPIAEVLPEIATSGLAKQRVRTDLFGDPLPQGAIARLGTTRLRQAWLEDFRVMPDGKTILSIGADGYLRFWDLKTARPVRTIQLPITGGLGKIWKMTLTPDCKTAVGKCEEKLIFWDTESGRQIKALPAPPDGIIQMGFSPDGRQLIVVAGSEGSVRAEIKVTAWEWASGKENPIAFPPSVSHANRPIHFCFSSDGKRFAGGGGFARELGPMGNAPTECVYDVASGRELFRVQLWSTASSISPDGNRLAVAGYSDLAGITNAVRMFDLASGKEEAVLKVEHSDSIRSLAFSPDGKTLACIQMYLCTILDCKTGRILFKLPGQAHHPSFSTDSNIFVYGSAESIRLFDLRSGRHLHEHLGNFRFPSVVAASPNGRYAATTNWLEGTVRLWDTIDGRMLRTLSLKGEKRSVLNLSFSADGRRLAASQSKGFIQFWNVATGEEERIVQLGDGTEQNKGPAFQEVQLSPDFKWVGTAKPLNSLQLEVWNANTGKQNEQRSLQTVPWHVTWLAIGKVFALSTTNRVEVRDLAESNARFQIPGSIDWKPVQSSSDGRLLAVWILKGLEPPLSGTIHLYESATGKEIASIECEHIYHFSLSRDTRSLIAITDHYLLIWDLLTGKERARWSLPIPGSFVYAMAISSDGKRTITSLGDASALVWDTSRVQAPGDLNVRNASENQFKTWWESLASEDARLANEAIWRLVDLPEKTALSFMREHLKPATNDSALEQHLILDLDNDSFAVRQKATNKLKDIGRAALPAMRQALVKKPTLEVRHRLQSLIREMTGLVSGPADIRKFRAIQVLELIGSQEARQLLSELAQGAAGDLQTLEAKESLARMAMRPAQVR